MTHHIAPLLAAALPAHPSFGEMLQFLLAGICVVFLALAFIATCTSVVAMILRAATGGAKPAPAPQPAVAKSGDELSEELVAVIAAAVAVAIGEPHRVLHIRERSPEEHSWGLTGRIQHHASHRIH